MYAGKWELLIAYNLLIINILEIARIAEITMYGKFNHKRRVLRGNITYIDVELFNFLVQVGTINFQFNCSSTNVIVIAH